MQNKINNKTVNNLNQRDQLIDWMRAFAMFWVLLVHSLYWGMYITNSTALLLQSFCLFEMPLMFYITGASNAYSETESGYFRFVFKRLTHIIIPYFIFAIICAAFSIYTSPYRWDAKVAFRILETWITPKAQPITSYPMLHWALWFIQIYVVTVFFIPFLKKLKSTNSFYIALLILIVCVIFGELFTQLIIRYVAFYLFWILIGIKHKQIIEALRIKKNRIVCALIALIGVACIIILHHQGCSLNMQDNKFPPNFMFLAFSIVAMSVFLLSVRFFKMIMQFLTKRQILNHCIKTLSTKSVTIFLYQPFAFLFATKLINHFFQPDNLLTELLITMLCLIIVLPLCIITAIFMNKIERFTINAILNICKINKKENLYDESNSTRD